MTAVTERELMGAEAGGDVTARVTQIQDAISGLTGFTYDPNGNLLTVADAKSQTTTYTYDNMDRLATRKDGLNRTESYQYDLAGNLTQFTDRKNQVTTFQYDALNRRTSSTYADATATFTYDTVGRLVKASDTAPNAGTIKFGYDILNRLIQETTGQGTVIYQYDVLGRRTQMTANGKQPTTYLYDAASRLTRVAQSSLFAALGYDNANRRTSLSYSNNTMTSYAYDLASRLTSITHNGPSGVIDALTYSYDAAGNRFSADRTNGTASLLPSAVASAAYDAANEQTAFAGTTLTYDANGNLTNDGISTYQWDARNRLIGISGSSTATFVYDPLGRRASKTINGASTQFAYDGYDIAAEIGGGTVGVNYLRSLNLDEPLIRQTNAGNEHYHTDALGSLLALSNVSGSSAASYGYEPFGKTTSTGSSSNVFQYTGRESDGTGLYYYRARYYQPGLQRFLAEDPLQFSAGSTNFYGYVSQNPLKWVDPMGFAQGPVYPPSVQISSDPNGSTTLNFDLNAQPGQQVTAYIDIGIVFEDGRGNFSNPNFQPLPGGGGPFTATANASGVASFTNINITGVTGYVKITTPGLPEPPSIVTGPVGPTGSMAPCKYQCQILYGYGAKQERDVQQGQPKNNKKSRVRQ